MVTAINFREISIALIIPDCLFLLFSNSCAILILNESDLQEYLGNDFLKVFQLIFHNKKYEEATFLNGKKHKFLSDNLLSDNLELPSQKCGLQAK